jgi:hypothetical protein
VAVAMGAAYTLGGRVADAVARLTPATAQSTAMERVYFRAFRRLSLGEVQPLASRLEEGHNLTRRTLHHDRQATSFRLVMHRCYSVCSLFSDGEHYFEMCLHADPSGCSTC